jgi:hypothetical protein
MTAAGAVRAAATARERSFLFIVCSSVVDLTNV